MNKQKNLILCLDWSNLAFRSLYMYSLFNDSETMDNVVSIDNYIFKFAQDLTSILKIFAATRIVFAADAPHSWRKDILKSYKSSRQKSKTFDWELIYKKLDAFRDVLERNGFIFGSAMNAEADDIMALVKEIAFDDDDFKGKENLIFVTADADIRQLIDFDQNTHQYAMVYDEIAKGKGGKRHLFCNSDMKRWLDDTETGNDIFFTNFDLNRNYVNNIISGNTVKKIQLEVTDPNNILLSKIFCGDDGDDVPAFYSWYGNKGNKIRVTNSKFVKLKELMEINSVKQLDAKKDMLKESLEKAINRDINDIDCNKRLVRQKKLVELKSELFPENIRLYKADLKYKLLNGKTWGTSIKMKDLIHDSDIMKTMHRVSSARDADIFSSLKPDFLRHINN